MGVGALAVAALYLFLSSLAFPSCGPLFPDPCVDPPRTRLVAAVTDGDLAAVRAELAAGADPDGDPGGDSPLLCAIEFEHPEVAAALLDGGASPGEVHAWSAVDSGQADVFDDLISHGLDLSAPASLDDGWLPGTSDDAATLADRLLQRSPYAIELHLLSVPPPAADRVGSDAERRRITEAVVAAGADPDGGSEGPSPLLWASYAGDAAVADARLSVGASSEHGGRVSTFLLEASADFPLTSAVQSAGGPFRGAAPEDLLPLDIGEAATGEVGNVSPLVGAVWGGNSDVARLLLDAGADPNAAAGGVFTAIYAAAVLGDGESAALLLERGAAAVPDVPPEVLTPAEAARRAGHADVAAQIDAAG